MSISTIPNPDELNAIFRMAKSANASKYYTKIGGEEGIFSIMLLARELGIPSMQAISGGIWNIQGKVEMSARMMNMKIRQAGHRLNITTWTEQVCVIHGIRKDTGEELTISFSMKDAERAKLSGKDNWQLYPRDMLFNRCLSIIARMLFPDVIGNCYVEGEISQGNEKDFDIEVHEKVKPAKKASTSSIQYEPVTLTAQIDAPASSKTINGEQAVQLVEALEGSEAKIRACCDYFQVKQLGDLPQSKFQEAIDVAGGR